VAALAVAASDGEAPPGHLPRHVLQQEEKPTMSKLPVRLALATVLVVTLAALAGAQAPGTACTSPLDPACNHLKCYQISDTPITARMPKTPLLQLDNQFGRELVFRLQPVLLCVPTQKSCCDQSGANCSPSNCNPDPVPAPALPHFKCYKIKVKTCTNPTCATLAKFSKGTQVMLEDQFGKEGPIPLGQPKMFCAPASKIVGPTTTTTTSTTETTTTTLGCHLDPLSNQCTGPCPPTAPAGSQCALLSSGQCGCVAPPVCCECTNSCVVRDPGPGPPGCNTVPNATCNASGTACGCGLCRDPAAPTLTCTRTLCSATQPCPSNLVCDPEQCPTPCDPCAQPASCNPLSCITPDGLASHCATTPEGCGCCGPTGAFCSRDGDCCSNVCNASSQTCN
jgi:hypothetical protein